MAHVSKFKKKTVEEFVALLDKYPVVAVANMANLPTKTVQNMRAKLREQGTFIKMTKKRLLKLAFQKAKKQNIADLEKYFKGMPALIFTEQNPFSLYSYLEKNKSTAPAKAGQVAPKDIIVKAGPTSFAPGPIISQLGKFGIKSGVENGKLSIKEDAVAAKEGTVITAELAGILTRLGIEPMEIGLDLIAAYENGIIMESNILYVDEKEYFAKFCSSYSEAFNLAVYASYPTEDTIKVLIGKSSNESKSLSIFSAFITSETVEDILSKAQREMLSLSNNLSDDALSESLKASKASAQVAKPSATLEVDDKKDESIKEEPKEEQSHEAIGLGSLFG